MFVRFDRWLSAVKNVFTGDDPFEQAMRKNKERRELEEKTRMEKAPRERPLDLDMGFPDTTRIPAQSSKTIASLLRRKGLRNK